MWRWNSVLHLYMLKTKKLGGFQRPKGQSTDGLDSSQVWRPESQEHQGQETIVPVVRLKVNKSVRSPVILSSPSVDWRMPHHTGDIRQLYSVIHSNINTESSTQKQWTPRHAPSRVPVKLIITVICHLP